MENNSNINFNSIKSYDYNFVFKEDKAKTVFVNKER